MDKGSHTYQHPMHKVVIWNAKSRTAKWLRGLRADGPMAGEVVHA
jgi:hypothetical protein